VTAYTHKLTAGYFEFNALGEAQIKGVEEPLKVYEVLGAGPLRTRLQVSATRGLTRFVGRQSEMEQIKRALDHAKGGHGQLVGVVGEPGLGKSRLFYEFKLTSQSGCLVLEAYSVSYGKASPYLPVIELLKSYFQLQPQDDERQRKEKITGKVLTLDRSLEDTLPYLFALLGIDDPTSSLQHMDPQIRRRRTFEAIKKLLLRESLNQPLILIFEDLHWIDSETQGFLDMLSEGVASARILLLVNYRPEYRHEWGEKTYYTQLHLTPLGKEEAEELLTFLLGSDSSLKSLKSLILEKTEGTPFFMEEVVQTLVEEGVLRGDRGHYRVESAPTALHISPTVHGVLAARIDRLAAAEKELLQQLAVIGREFRLSLVHQVIALPEETLYRGLASLQSKEFLYEQPAFPEVAYTFKHALTQEVAYNSLLQERRKALHERTAQVIEALFHNQLEDHYSELAHHYSRSGDTPKAVEYLGLAGQQAAQRSAHAQALEHLTSALEVLQRLPDTPERAQLELGLQTTLGPLVMMTKGWAGLEVEKVYVRAHELSQQTGATGLRFSALMGLYALSLVQSKLPEAQEWEEQLLSLARQQQDPALLLEAHHACWSTALSRGELSVAQTHAKQGLALYDPQLHHSHAWLYTGHDPGVCARVWGALVSWLQGYPAQALQSAQTALTLARELAHPFTIVFVLTHAAQLYQFRREGLAAQERAETALTLAAEQGFPFWLVWGSMLRGWAVAEQGQVEEGIVQLRQGLAAYQATGAEMWRPYFLAQLAEAYGKGGQVGEGLAALAEALEFVDRTEERFYEAELYRLRGELTLARSSVQGLASSVQGLESEAEGYFLKAIEVARKQQAKSLELRAVMSLSWLWQSQGKRDEARQMLAEIYGWFTEGFETADLKEAKALLEELDH